MVNNPCESNVVTISGKIATEPIYSHELYGEGFYCFMLDVMRLSSSCDRIPVMVSERLNEFSEYQIGRYIEIEGQFRSYNATGETGTKLVLSVFAREVCFSEPKDEQQNLNTVVLDGYICKPPIYRTTPFNREITDILLAVNRSYNKSDYIPCISWGRNARYCGRRNVGDHVKITGRIQSRKYQKKLPNGEVLEKVAYEVSVSKLELLEKCPAEAETDAVEEPVQS